LILNDVTSDNRTDDAGKSCDCVSYTHQYTCVLWSNIKMIYTDLTRQNHQGQQQWKDK
ncbi:GSCOCG00003717001-RA-CDS, partial [Cotesia congregata]